MDYQRECYQSSWYLFRDSPGTATAGYYYFAAEDAEPLPFLHHFGSRRFHDANWRHVQALGEDLTFKQQHVDGEFAGDKPVSRHVGERDCFEKGELLAEQADPADLFHGYPLQCWLPRDPVQPPPPPLPRDFEAIAAWDRCGVQRLWATIISWLYDEDAASINTVLHDFCADPVTVTVVPRAGLYPAIAIARGSNWAAVAIEGTTDFQQLAMQALRNPRGPTDYGLFSTNSLWYQASTYTHLSIQLAGITDGRPILFVGHSYGAAIACILSARYRHGMPERDIKYLVYGCPKIGDSRLQLLVSNCSGRAIRNHNDIVTAVPPDATSLSSVLGAFPQFGDYLYEPWRRPPISYTQDEDGVLIGGGSFEITTLTLLEMLGRVVLDQPFSQVAGHGITEYLRRIDLRCPGVGWPIDTQVDDDLNTYEPSEGGLVFDGTGVIDVAFYPQRWTMFPHDSLIISGNPIQLFSTAAQLWDSFSCQNAAADGDEWTQGFLVKAGVYTLRFWGITELDCGKIDVFIDGVQVITGMDWYTLATTLNVVKDTSVTVVGDGYHVLRVLVNGKNAASADFRLFLTYISLFPATDTQAHS